MREQSDDLFFRIPTFPIVFHIVFRVYYSGMSVFDDLEKYLGDESIFTKIPMDVVGMIWGTCLVNILICPLYNFMFCALMFCFMNPQTLEQFRNWALAMILPISNACSTFALWIFGICQTVFQKIKTKVQDFLGLFYN